MSKKDKTNVMRVLEQNHIDYEAFNWTQIQRDRVQAPIYKTLVTVGKSKQNYVYLIPKDKELDLKKAAKIVDEKNMMMIPEKELLPLTGYVHGGCSPIGMKKTFPTVLDESALDYPDIIFSAGKREFAVKVNPDDLSKLIDVKFADVSKEKGGK